MTNELTLFQTIFLAVLQGVTEFLPVSSSGHLVIARNLFGWSDEGGLVFDTLLHAGSLAAILLYFRRTLLGILSGCIPRKSAEHCADRRLLWLIPAATLPVAMAAPWLKNFIENGEGARNGLTVGLSMLATALLFALCDLRVKPSGRPIGLRGALFTGVMQVVALLPGASRSGWTCAGGILSGQSREGAVRFAFLLAIPAIAGAVILQSREITQAIGSGPDALRMSVAFSASFLASLASIHFCMVYFRKHSLRGFSVYLAAAGLLAAALHILRP